MEGGRVGKPMGTIRRQPRIRGSCPHPARQLRHLNRQHVSTRGPQTNPTTGALSYASDPASSPSRPCRANTTASPPSTSTTWSRSRPSWRPPAATKSPVIVQASRGARKYTNDNFLRHLMLAAAELYPELPIVMHQDHGNSPDDLRQRHPQRLHQRHDGRLARGRRQDARELRVQRRRHPRSREHRPPLRRFRRRRAWLSGLARERHRRERRRPRCRGQAVHRPAPDRSRPGGRLRRAHRHRRAGRRHRHQPRRLQVLAQADRRRARHEAHRGDPHEAAQLPPGHARLVSRCRTSSATSSTSTAAR